MTYDEAIKFINSNSLTGSILGLERIKKLNKLAGDPQKNLKFIHVAGTNGKGSTSNMIMNILIEAEYKVGMFTSPSIESVNEKIQINAIPISNDELAQVIAFLKPFIETMDEHPTEFELITEIAIEYFSQNKCDFVVFEVGMGGRTDSTNIITNTEVAVITSIGYDHMLELGETLEAIATEKAGIIKPNIDVVLYQQDQIVHKVVEKTCKLMNSKLHVADFTQINQISFNLMGQRFSIPGFDNIFITLLGDHQQKNTCIAVQTILTLRKNGWDISDENIYSGLAKTKWPARFEILHQQPVIILDGGHNTQCFDAIFHNLDKYFKDRKITFVIGILADKEYKTMLDIIAPLAKQFFTITPNNPRALSSDKLAEYIKKYKLPVLSCSDPINGIDTAIKSSNKDDVICVLGSLYIAGVTRSYFGPKL